MSSDLYLSRVRLRKDAPIHALARLLVPSSTELRAGASHRLLWTLFADAADRSRDFLWREAEPGQFYILSRRVPNDQHRMFEIDPPKAFTPSLNAGDRLAFSLRANATIARGGGAGKRGKPCDVVMDALYHAPPGARAEQRTAKISEAGLGWLARQGAKNGFTLGGNSSSVSGVDVTSYHTMRVEHRGTPLRLGVLEFEGVLQVSDPKAFVDAVASGFGRAKAFGCGLMLLRRG